jgi:hypothetical protein
LITPANISKFDLINCQTYGGSNPSDDVFMDTPRDRFSWGVNTEPAYVDYPLPGDYEGLAGIFNWSMSADHARDWEYTRRIAKDVGYASGK